MAENQKVITRKNVKSKFGTIGLALILYSLCVLVLPIAIKNFLIMKNSIIMENQDLYVGLYYVMILVGTIFPFSIISSGFKIKFNSYFKKASITTSQLIKEFLMFFTIASIGIFATFGITNYLGIRMNLIFNLGALTSETYFDNKIYIFLFIIACPLVEEIAFRGCLLSSLSRFGKKFAIIFSAVFYALAHGNFVEMIPAFVIGYLMGKIEIKYDSLQPCILIHIFFNLFIYLFYVLSDQAIVYATVGLVIIYLISLMLCITRKYRFLFIKSNKDIWPTIESFVTTPTIIIATVLFLLESVIIEILLL